MNSHGHQLAPVAATQVTGVNIKTVQGEIELRKDRPTIGRSTSRSRPEMPTMPGHDLSISSPRASNTRVDRNFVPALDLVGATYDHRSTTPQGSESVSPPRASITPSSCESTKPLEKDPAHIYAKLSTRDRSCPA